MSSRRRRLDPVGPFGNPDGSRADIEDLISEFVDFGGDPAFGHLATRANDSMVRVIVGKLGAGKTVYLRRLQAFQAQQDSVYAGAPQQNLPKTEVVVKACQWFSDQVLVEKWMQIWERAIMRSLATHLLRRPELRQQIRDEQADEIEQSYARLLDDSQLAQCANQVSSDLMPQNAALHDYSELFTSTQAYITGVQEDVRSFVRLIGTDRFSRADLIALQEVADLHFEKATDLASVLWQNGLLGYVDDSGRRRFYSMGDIEEFHFPPEVGTYVLHPCLVYAVGGIRHVQADSTGAGAALRTKPFTSVEHHDLPEASAAAPPPVGSHALPEPDPAELRSSAAVKVADYAVGNVIEGRFEILGMLGQGDFNIASRFGDPVHTQSGTPPYQPPDAGLTRWDVSDR